MELESYLVSLPAELIYRILLCSIESEPASAGVLTISTLSLTCSLLHQLSQQLWRELLLPILGEHHTPLSSSQPGSWRQWRDGAIRSVSIERTLLKQYPSLPRPTFGHSSCVWERKLYLFGGRDDATHFGTLEVLNLDLHEWRVDVPTLGKMPSCRRLHSAVVDQRNGTMCACAPHADCTTPLLTSGPPCPWQVHHRRRPLRSQRRRATEAGRHAHARSAVSPLGSRAFPTEL